MLAAICAACASPASSQETAGPDAVRLFERACARCHAADGSGGLAMAQNGPKPIDLRSADWQAARTDDEIVSAIRDGRGAMPPFRDVLNDAETLALAGYVRRLNASP